MRHTLASGVPRGGAATTCQNCARTVRMVPVDGRLVAVDPEVIAVVPAGPHGNALASATAVTGRRMHAELCDTYAREAQREKTRRELAEYNKKNGRRRAL